MERALLMSTPKFWCAIGVWLIVLVSACTGEPAKYVAGVQLPGLKKQQGFLSCPPIQSSLRCC